LPGAVLLAGYVTLRLTALSRRITQDNIKTLRKGMTEEEVEAILGVQGKGKHLIGSYQLPFRPFPGAGALTHFKEWVEEDSCVLVSFDEAGRVIFFCTGSVNESKSFLAKLRAGWACDETQTLAVFPPVTQLPLPLE
jgi:hypothetical protein